MLIIGEQSVEYFVQPNDYFADIYASCTWLHPLARAEVAACCGASSSTACLAPEASAAFCESAFSAISRSDEDAAAADGTEADADIVQPQPRANPTHLPPPSPTHHPHLPPPLISGEICSEGKGDGVGRETCDGDGGEGGGGGGDGGDGEEAVFGFMHGFDLERLLPFVESLRATGFKGTVRLVHSNPEIR